MGLVLAIVTILLPEFWIERLGAETIDGREEASRWLKELGWASMPALLAAERHPDPEIAERVRMLLGSIPLGDRLSPELRQAIPGIEDRLAGGKDEVWLELFLAASKLPQIPTRDLELLLEPSCRAARSADEKTELIRFLLKARIVWTMRLLADFLVDPDMGRIAWQGLDSLGPKLRVEALTWLLEGDYDLGPLFLRRIRALEPLDAARSLDLQRPRKGVLKMALLLRDEGMLRSPEVIELLDSIPVILPMVHDPDPAVRMAALAAVTRIANRPR